jgi:hypothetical protein
MNEKGLSAPRFQIGQRFFPKPGKYTAMWGVAQIITIFYDGDYGIDGIRYTIEVTYKMSGKKDLITTSEKDLVSHCDQDSE